MFNTTLTETKDSYILTIDKRNETLVEEMFLKIYINYYHYFQTDIKNIVPDKLLNNRMG